MKFLRILRLLLSVLVFGAIGRIIAYLVENRPDFSLVSFFSFFTNQSNILVALFFLISLSRMSRNAYDRTRGALILYMSMTTSIYWIFLRNLVHFKDDLTAAANIFLHSACLFVLLIDLVVDRPQTRMCKRFFVIWMIYPVGYGLAILGLGALRGWYPYPFLDIEKLGFEKWVLWNGPMACGIGLLGVLIILLNNSLLEEPPQNSVKV